MITAEKMYQYCIDNGFGEGMNKKWGVKHFTLIEHSLKSNEQVLLCFIGLHNYISMTKHDNNFAYAITNKRMIMAQQKMIGQTLQSISLENVNDVTMNTGMLLGTITVDTIKEKFNVGVNTVAAQKISDKIHEILITSKKNTQATNNISVADELLKFKKLLEMGVITQAEFTKKKNELLNL